MYSFKKAVRVEVNNTWTRSISQILEDPLPSYAKKVGFNQHGYWFKVELPASVWALVVESDEGVTAAVYHSPKDADAELKEALNDLPPVACD